MRAIQQMAEAVPSQTLVLKAPLSGRLVPIERVPDPVFAQKITMVQVVMLAFGALILFATTSRRPTSPAPVSSPLG